MADAPVRFRRLLPPSGDGEHDIAALLEERPETLDGHRERPHVMANFVSSVDGRAAFQGRSSALGDAGDKAIFHALREHVDVVVAGTATIGAEGYGRMLASAERRARRRERGRSEEPLAATLTRSGHVPTDAPLFSEPEARVVVYGPASVREQLAGCAAQVELVALGPGELNWGTALRHLRAEFGAGTVLCEGGPSVFGALLRDGLVDELFLTLSPHLVGGGDAPAITKGPELGALAGLEYRWLLQREQTLYARFAVTN